MADNSTQTTGTVFRADEIDPETGEVVDGIATQGMEVENFISSSTFVPGGEEEAINIVGVMKVGERKRLGTIIGRVYDTEEKTNYVDKAKDNLTSWWAHGVFESVDDRTGVVKVSEHCILPKTYARMLHNAVQAEKANNGGTANLTFNVIMSIERLPKALPYTFKVTDFSRSASDMKALSDLRRARDAREQKIAAAKPAQLEAPKS